LIPSVEFLDDTVGIGGPDEGFGIVVGDKAVDGALEIEIKPDPRCAA
jgi:hypothetical protein